MITHNYRTVDVPVAGGMLRVGIWDPIAAAASVPPRDVLLIHGVTSSHRAFPFLVAQLPGVRVIAPDLRGRGSSHTLGGPAGMRAHALDLIAVLDALDVDSLPVVGHSMGGFVAVVLSRVAPERVTRLLLIDGGLPIEVPAGLSPEQLVAAILGPTAERLSMRFASLDEYLAFWRVHPAFADDWSRELEEYLAYDLVADGDAFRSATSLATTAEDTVDLNAGDDLPVALAALTEWGRAVRFVTVPRGLRDEEPGLYSEAAVERVLAAYPDVSHERLAGLNHYTIVMSERGARALAPLLREAVDAQPVP